VEDLTYGGSRGRGCSLDLLGCLSERIERSRIAVELPLRMDIEKDQGIKTIPTGSAKQAGDLGRSLRAPAIATSLIMTGFSVMARTWATVWLKVEVNEAAGVLELAVNADLVDVAVSGP